MQGITSPIMKKLIVALKHVDEINEGMVLLSMMQRMIPRDDFDILSRFFTFPGQAVVMTDANCIKLKLFMAIGIMNQVFTARFHIILRGGFAVRMNILKTMQTVGSFATTKDMDDLIGTSSNTDLDCLVVPEIGVVLSMGDQSEIIKLLQMSIATTVERFKAKQLEYSLSKRSEVSQTMKQDLQNRMDGISARMADLGEDEESQKISLNALLQKLQTNMDRMVVSVAPTYPVELEIKNAAKSALTTKLFWKPMKDTKIELMDVTMMPAHDASSGYADVHRMKQIISENAVWYYPGHATLLMEYLNVIHNIRIQIQELSKPLVLSDEYRASQLNMQTMLEKFKSRSIICYRLLKDPDRATLRDSLHRNRGLLLEFDIAAAAASKKGGAKSRRSKHKPRVRRTKKRNSRKIRK